MSYYSNISYRIFSQYSQSLARYFIDTKVDLKKARIKLSVQEFMSVAIMSSFLVFVISLPILSFLLSYALGTFLFGFVTAITISFFSAIFTFFIFLNYPRIQIRTKGKEVDNVLPYASLYLSTVAGSKLPLHRTLEIFSKFSSSGEMAKEVDLINDDIKVFGLDINTALERAIDRSPSNSFKEILYGILSTIRSGGDLSIYLKEKSRNLMAEYRRRLYEFSHSLTVYIEVYLTSIVLGTIFFTVLSAIISGIGGAAGNIIMLQFFLIFLFLPLISVLFIVLIKSITPGGE